MAVGSGAVSLLGGIVGAGRRALARFRAGVPDHARLSWSQEGEDLLLCALFERFPPRSRFYVDVGAHHPERFSNTRLFYGRGWRGINIDAAPGSMDDFNRLRPGDINLETAISDHAGVSILHQFDETAIATLSEEVAERKKSDLRFHGTGRVQVRTQRLEDVLSSRIAPGHPIAFMSIDVEGWELPVLRSMDWSRWMPGVLLVEELDLESSTAVAGFLGQLGYSPIARTLRTAFYLAPGVDDRDTSCPPREGGGGRRPPRGPGGKDERGSEAQPCGALFP